MIDSMYGLLKAAKSAEMGGKFILLTPQEAYHLVGLYDAKVFEVGEMKERIKRIYEEIDEIQAKKLAEGLQALRDSRS